MSILCRHLPAVCLTALAACVLAARPAATQDPGDAPGADGQPASPPAAEPSPPGVPARLRTADGDDVPGRWLEGPGILWRADAGAELSEPTALQTGRLILQSLPEARDMTPLRRQRAQAEARRKAALRGAWRPANASPDTARSGPVGDDSRPTPAAETAWVHAIHLRGGEVLPGRLSAIDAAGVRFATERLGEAHFPHGEVRMLELGDTGERTPLADPRRRRLMTLPRTQTDSPPSHLLALADGDFLRGRLLSVDGERLTFATPAGEMPIQRPRVLGIAWLTRPDEADDTPSRSETGRSETGRSETGRSNAFHVTRTDGARVTLRGVTHRDGAVRGEHRVLSTCQIPIGEIAEIRRGVDPPFSQPPASGVVWRLRAAPLPLVDRLDDAAPAEDRRPSPGDG